MGAGTLGGVTSVLGLISGVTVDDAAATATGLVIAPHGSAKNVSLTLASAEIFSGGTATSLTALSATIRVAAGAATTGTRLGLGGTQVLAGGSAISAVISSALPAGQTPFAHATASAGAAHI